MKKILFILFLSLPFYISAQDFRFGIKGGFNLANFQGEDNGGHYKFGGYAGLFASYNFTDVVGIQSEILYSQQGFRDHIDSESATISLDYITVPVLISFSLRNYEQFKFVLGPQVAYLVRSKEDPDVYTDDNPIAQILPKSDTFEDIDYGAVVGLEYEFSDQFLLNARYYHGLAEFFNQDKVESEAQNRTFSLGVAYRF